MASMREKSQGVWELRAYIGTDGTGRRKQVSRTFRGTKRDATKALAQLSVDVQAGEHAPDDGTVAQMFAAYLEHQATRIEATTLDTYRSWWRLYLEPTLGRMQARRVTPRDLDQLYGALVTGHATGRKLSPSTVRKAHNLVHGAFGAGERWGMVVRNPAEKASPPPVRTAEIKPPATADVAKLLTILEAEDRQLAPWVRLAVATGARRGEICGLQWDDVDFTAGTVTIRRAIGRTDAGLVIKAPKTHQVRTVNVGPTTIALLKAHRAAQASQRLFRGTGGSRWVFCDQLDPDEPWAPNSVTRSWLHARLRVPGLASARVHDLRHLHASQLLEQGHAVTTVGKRLGHANAHTTLAIYGHGSVEADRLAGGASDRLLG